MPLPIEKTPPAPLAIFFSGKRHHTLPQPAHPASHSIFSRPFFSVLSQAAAALSERQPRAKQAHEVPQQGPQGARRGAPSDAAVGPFRGSGGAEAA